MKVDFTNAGNGVNDANLLEGEAYRPALEFWKDGVVTNRVIRGSGSQVKNLEPGVYEVRADGSTGTGIRYAGDGSTELSKTLAVEVLPDQQTALKIEFFNTGIEHTPKTPETKGSETTAPPVPSPPPPYFSYGKNFLPGDGPRYSRPENGSISGTIYTAKEGRNGVGPYSKSGLVWDVVVADASSHEVIRKVKAKPGGVFEFSDLAPGVYEIAVDGINDGYPHGWENKNPDSFVADSRLYVNKVEVKAGVDSKIDYKLYIRESGFRFSSSSFQVGNGSAWSSGDLGSLSGTIVWDWDQSKDINQGDEPIPGHTVVITKDGKEVGRIQTGENGFYQSIPLIPGEYGIRVENPAGGIMTFEDRVSTVKAGQDDPNNDWGFYRDPNAPVPPPTVTETTRVTTTKTHPPVTVTTTLPPETVTTTVKQPPVTVTSTPAPKTVTSTPPTATTTVTEQQPPVTVTETPEKVTETVTPNPVTETVTKTLEKVTETVTKTPEKVTETKELPPVTVTETPGDDNGD